jgi:hypothetical protein
MRLLGESTQQAADEVVDHLARDGGIGGVIALDNKGNGKPSICSVISESNFKLGLQLHFHSIVAECTEATLQQMASL